MRPIRPPPLAALQLKPTPQGPCFLTCAIADEIRNLLPQRLQVHDRWQCIYNLNVHGVSLGTLYHHCFAYRDRLGERPGFVVAVQDRQGQVFGAYVNEYLRPEAGFYGNGECFLWKVQSAHPGPASEYSGVAAIRFKAYPWTGMNDYQLYCTPSFISFGGGNGKYGLWLDDRLEQGVSGMTETFGNESLCDGVEEGRRFEVVSVEVWKV
ncbi:TLD-domain-containing protein [Protomyces lactucae-debilis]|uniref:Oxidation resistance protein 1 n=1 Tax=Protomyces lactucae-debilis TaxID=2754530 RepID=A0A1Y2F6H1_PROLT|nr:TLD-domain-containing protein [Protomyces lactucae-debilis]ORY79481.1 TLD-domain-containing protein [Protomyces lactucae-debilis]